LEKVSKFQEIGLVALTFLSSIMSEFYGESFKIQGLSVDTALASYDPCPNDPYGSTSMPIYQTATFRQPGATEFGEYDYTRSGNPTRAALENQIALLENSPECKSFCFSTGMASSKQTGSSW